jgi:hypothetical protein
VARKIVRLSKVARRVLKGVRFVRLALLSHIGVAKMACSISASSNEFGSGVRGGSISPQDINRLLRQGPPSLRHIQVNKIIVVDHLGRNLPVPAIFCSAWEVRCN